MQITHVGSLPHKSIDQALAYTFDWDIPVLFTLPKKNPNQFMGQDLDYLLQITSYGLKSNSKIEAFYESEFLKELKNRNVSKFKYQLIGPITFYQLYKDKVEFSFEELVEFMQLKYSELLQRYSSYANILFCLDEPMLDKNYSFYNSTRGLSFFKSLENNAEIFIHSCAKLDLNKVQNILSYLNLDLNLYAEKDSNLKTIEFAGGRYLAHAKYFSPSCGLALKSVDECEVIKKELRELIS